MRGRYRLLTRAALIGAVTVRERWLHSERDPRLLRRSPWRRAPPKVIKTRRVVLWDRLLRYVFNGTIGLTAVPLGFRGESGSIDREHNVPGTAILEMNSDGPNPKGWDAVLEAIVT
jgi:hypothetical protein